MKNVKLSTKLISGGLIIALVPLMIIGMFTVITASKALDDLEKEQLINLKRTVIALINTKLNEQVKLLVNASTNDATIAEITRTIDTTGVSEMAQFRLDINTTIYHDKNTYEIFRIADKNGIVIGDTSGGIHLKTDISETDYFRSAIKGDTLIGKVVKSKESGHPYVIGAGPMKTTNNDIIGVIVIGWKTDDLNKKINELKFGMTGYAFIADKDGMIISHPDNSAIMNSNVRDSGEMAIPGMRMIATEDGIEEFGPKGGEKLIAFGPIETGKWSLGLVIPKSEYMSPIMKMRNIILFVSILTGVMVISLIFLFIRRSITVPVGSLIESVRTIAEGNYGIPAKWDQNDEIGMLVSDVDRMRLAIKDLTENLEEKVRDRTIRLEEANEKISMAMNELWGEMELAKKIQTCLLPDKPEISGYEIKASLEAADEVGGDYYDVISVAGYDWIVIGDVSGHGITAGLVMMMVQTAIHTVLLENPVISPSALLSAVNWTIYENIEKMSEQKHMTILVLAAEKTGIFSFSGLHENILIWRAANRKVEKVETNGMWIGIESDISEMLSTDKLKLEHGDCIVLYTDGIIEARCEQGKMFEEERLIGIIESSGGKSAAEIHTDILNALNTCEKPDDVTLFVMKRCESA